MSLIRNKITRVIFLVLSFLLFESVTSTTVFALEKKRIAVIGGGGAGVTTAWLLEQDYDVTLYEKGPRLGGDANTVEINLNGKTYPVDAGFEFINKQGFPNFFRLLQLANVKLNTFQLTATFTSSTPERSFVITPIRDEGIAWGSILKPKNLFDLIRLKKYFDGAKKFVEIDKENSSDQKEMISMREYFEQTHVNPTFKEEFLIPLLSSGWGVSRSEVETWSTENLLRTVLTESNGISAPEWHEIVGGTQKYIQALTSQFTNTEALVSTEITAIHYNEDSKRYRVSSNDRESFYDMIVIATPAHQVSSLLKEVANPEIAEISKVLNSVDYYKSHIAIHGDLSFMPKDKSQWSVVNIRTNRTGTQSGMTMYKKWLSPTNSPIFKSWILEGDPIPQPLYAEAFYLHRKLNSNYITAKRAVKQFQGKHNLWFAGAHTLGDRHENAILSAILVAKKLSPRGHRLNQLLKSN